MLTHSERVCCSTPLHCAADMHQQVDFSKRCASSGTSKQAQTCLQHSRLASRRLVRPASATSQAPSAPASAASPPGNPLLMAVIEAAFGFKPFFEAASRNARSMIIKRAEAIGIDWERSMTEMQGQDWQSLMKAFETPGLQYPSYYTQPFHAYAQGNLCWEAAKEVTMAAKSVHALVMDPDGKKLDPEGDHAMRSAYSSHMQRFLQALGKEPGSVRDVLDLGAATGLSSLELMRVFPGARVTALDLSPHFLAVGKYLQQQREASSGQAEPLHFMHAAAEATGLPSSSQDLVSICLVCHELPQAATKAVFKEAFRVLRPGGALAIMEMDPTTAPFRRILSNPFAYTAFKSTEPWLQEYMGLDMNAAITAEGFGQPQQCNNTPRHKTVVAIKP